MTVSYPDTTSPINVPGLPGFGTPPSQLPEVLQQAVDEYMALRNEHGERLRHLNGSYRRIQDGRQRDITEARKARQGGKQVAPRFEVAAQQDQDATLLGLEALRQQAAEAEQTVKKVARETEADYRRALDQQA
jgi:hypothetical protein